VVVPKNIFFGKEKGKEILHIFWDTAELKKTFFFPMNFFQVFFVVVVHVGKIFFTTLLLIYIIYKNKKVIPFFLLLEKKGRKTCYPKKYIFWDRDQMHFLSICCIFFFRILFFYFWI
jgi:hypothetical protein